MKSTLQVPSMVLGMIAILAGAGCGATSGPVAASPHFAAGLSPGLVMTSQQDTATWEYGRYDDLLNVGQQPTMAAGWAETRMWDYQRTSNGRPREQSTTYTRSLARRVSY